MTDELWRHTAIELARLFRDGDATATAICEAHLARIDEINPSLNAVVRRFDDDVLATAAAIDQANSEGQELGPLAGVPFTIKDNIDLAGDPTTQGLELLADFIPESDTPIVERLKIAGAIPLARTNLPDMGLRVHTDSQLHGLTRNPWSQAHTTAGSSGGEAASLASGMSPFGLGNDLGGSLRNPASCCSVASLKPTLGRIPHTLEGILGDESIVEQLIAVEGPMARTVGDVRAVFGVIAGAHPRDPWSVPVPLVDEDPRTRRVALVAEPPRGSTDPQIAAVTRQVGEALSAAGHVVEEVAPPSYTETIECWHALVLGGIGASLDQLRPLVGADAMTVLEGFNQYADSDMTELAWTNRLHLLRGWNEFFTGWDAIVSPTWTQLPFEHGYDLSEPDAVLELMRPVMPANVLGLPSAAVPAGLVDGLPVGVIVNGPAWSEHTCLEIAEDIELAGLAPPTPIDPVLSAAQ